MPRSSRSVRNCCFAKYSWNSQSLLGIFCSGSDRISRSLRLCLSPSLSRSLSPSPSLSLSLPLSLSISLSLSVSVSLPLSPALSLSLPRRLSRSPSLSFARAMVQGLYPLRRAQVCPRQVRETLNSACTHHQGKDRAKRTEVLTGPTCWAHI